MRKIISLIIGILLVTVAISQNEQLSKSKDGLTYFSKNNFFSNLGPCICSKPITADEFDLIIKDIKRFQSDSKKLTTAKKIIKDKCLLSAQVKEILFLFILADTRFNFAEYAYEYAFDQENYNAEIASCFPVNAATTNFIKVTTHNELNDNWERTNQSNVLYMDRLQVDYGGSEILK